MAACHCSIRRWVRGSLIGAGSFGKVNLALNVASGELFAVKSIDCSRSSSGRAEIAAMENELRLLQSLDSPYIIKCYGGAETWEEGVQMRNMFMEYMAGGSLADLMRKFGGALDEGLIRVYTRGIVEGLEYLHGQGIVHCDVKGKNILIGGTGVKIADLGSAKRVEEQVHAMRGTPLWMAPEVIMQEEQGLASDIWSLGCTVVEMATGRPPWSHAHLTPLAALMQIGAGQALPPLPDCLSQEAKDFLRKCLHPNPKQRWTASQLLSHPFLQKHHIHHSFSDRSFCKHHVVDTPLSPTSVLDASGSGSTSVDSTTSSWEGNGRSVPLLHCPELGLLGSSGREGGAALSATTTTTPAAAKDERIEDCNCSPPATPAGEEEARSGWITVRSPRPRGEERQRPLSHFMLGAEATEVGGSAGGTSNLSLQSLQFLRGPRRPPIPPSATSSPRQQCATSPPRQQAATLECRKGHIAPVYRIDR